MVVASSCLLWMTIPCPQVPNSSQLRSLQMISISDSGVES